MLLNPYWFVGNITPPIGLPAPLEGIDTIYLVGASIEAQIVSTYGPLAASYLATEYGINVTVGHYGYSGANIDTVSSNWYSTIKPDLQARSDGGAGVLLDVMPFGNTITELAPYAAASSTSKDEDQATYNAMIADMKTVVGSRNVNCVNHTFRNYAPSGSCITDQTLGSQPFNENWVWPQAQLTDWWYEGRPYSDPYPIGFNNYTTVFLNGTDPVHYNPLFNATLLRHRVDCCAAMILGTAPPRIAMKADPITDTKPRAGKALIIVRNSGLITRPSNMLTGTARGALAKDASVFLAASNGYDPVLGIAARPTSPSVGTQSGLGTGVVAETIYNDTILSTYCYVNSSTWFLVETITNLIPNSEVDVKILAARSTATSRLGEWSFDGANVAGEVDASCVSGQVPNVLSLTATATSAGELQLWTRNKAGNTTGTYWNAYEIDGREH